LLSPGLDGSGVNLSIDQAKGLSHCGSIQCDSLVLFIELSTGLVKQAGNIIRLRM